MSEIAATFSDLFTEHVHHQNLSVLYILQNIFNNTKNYRTLSLNANDIVLFENPRDKVQVSHLAYVSEKKQNSPETIQRCNCRPL